MLVHTRTHHTRTSTRKKVSLRNLVRRKKNVPWRQVAHDNIKKFTEPGMALKGARLRAQMTQLELAKTIRVKPYHIYEMEHGKRPIYKEMAHRLEKALNVSYKVFL